MSMGPTSEQTVVNVVALGRCYVRLVESADYLLEHQPTWLECFALRLLRSLYSHKLRELVAALPDQIAAEILAEPEKTTEPVRGFTQN